jgi:hypothetical protein
MSQAQELKKLVGAEAERRAIREEVGLLLPSAYRERLERILELVSWLLAILEMKNLSIAKLCQLCFGSTTESARKVCGRVFTAATPPRAGTQK